MSDKEQRALWAEHLRDEADAIAEQQSTAGDSHAPLEGPLPHTRNETVAAAQDAVLDERERCAALAGSYTTEAALRQVLGEATPAELQSAARLALHIAQAIRSHADRRP